MVTSKRKTVLLTGIIFLLTATAVGLSFNVGVRDEAEVSTSLFEYNEEVDSLQNFSASVENPGSVGCKYRLKVDYETDNESHTFYSNPEPLLPGQERQVDIKTLPGEENRTWRGNVSVDFCGNEKVIDTFEYNQTQSVEDDWKMLESQVVEVTDTSATIKTEKEDLLLLPKDVPPHWKVSYAESVGDEAVINYDPYLFEEGRKLEFIAFNETSGRIVGNTEFRAEQPEPTLQDLVVENLLNGLLVLSIIANILLGTILYRKQSFKE